MPGKVILEITQGPMSGEKYEFLDRDICIIGREADCHPKLPDDDAHLGVSRHHCFLDINPPEITVRDFGSLNGTYLNGIKIGQRDEEMSPADSQNQSFLEHELEDSDHLLIGETIFLVKIESPALPDPELDRTTEIDNPASFFKVMAGFGEDGLPCIPGYRIIKELGRGGMGAVYFAKNERSGAQVALKILLPGVAVDPRNRDNFLREVENTKILQHPNIISLKDSGYANNIFYFTMEFCNLGSVGTMLDRKDQPLTVPEAGHIIMQVLDGLAYAHQVEVPEVRLFDGGIETAHGLIHRDIKPDNILLSLEQGVLVARISDFGLAKAFDLAGLSGCTMTGSRIGSMCFISRQQLVNFKYASPEVDVWAAAATLYYLLTGQPPRDFNEGEDPLKIILQEVPLPIRQRNPQLPKKLANLIDEALYDQEDLKYQDVAGFKAALVKVLP